ncbi:SPOR domain-containing protein [Pelagerythrobacter rhizovicinus]|uniref:Sporulation protein n=1 Tax=Pelagerythrobacter rhizovicinus TaxID=2268576 RepID=A0A4Q2KPI3_9SPHN|nr:SPOR domain-containing protein [Pelagerythrobacter rhizovicinus]RXZ65522.1 sporulation protein [Pelagerythrobacter rhizovicinus]
MRFAHALSLFAAGTALAIAAPALADVKAGVDAWSRGDYAAAVREWREPAAQGNPDAQFNMAQAYRLGRGVERDQQQAEAFYARAAAQGHIKAADNYGLMLFQAGRREEAMPYVLAASERGDPRAQYLLGIAHFNGDLVEKDWVRAYALLTLANSAGLPQANPAIRQMDEYIPLEQRQEAQVLAQQLKRESDATRAQQLAAVDLALDGEATAAPAARPAATVPPTSGRRPMPIARTPVSPSVAAAQAAIVEASRVTGTDSPAEAGADYARPAVAAASPSPSPASAPQQPRPEPQPERTTAAAPTASPSPSRSPSSSPPSSDGPWRVQLGAFSVAGNADRLWRDVAGLAPLAGKEKLLVRTGRLTKLQAGGFATRGAAQAACDSLKAAGRACLVTR